MASHADTGTSPGWKCPNSPDTALQITNAIPANIICQPAFTELGLPAALYLEYNDPAAHEILATTNIANAAISLLPLPPVPASSLSFCPNNNNTPTEPTINPAIVALL